MFIGKDLTYEGIATTSYSYISGGDRHIGKDLTYEGIATTIAVLPSLLHTACFIGKDLTYEGIATHFNKK